MDPVIPTAAFSAFWQHPLAVLAAAGLLQALFSFAPKFL